MRLSVDDTDPGFSTRAARGVIYFNGERQSPISTKRALITADEELGFIRFYLKGSDGQYIRNNNGAGDSFRIFELTGDVRIVMPD